MPTFTDPSSNSKAAKLENQTQNQQQPTLDFDKIKDFNSKSVDLIFDDKIENALEILKKIEIFLEANAIETKVNLNKKILIIILHNLACCYQKLKDYENCISYLEAVIYHFDSTLQPKHKIQINEDYFTTSIFQDQSSYSLLGDFILELRFSAKFHLQMCAVLSQANRHIEALNHSKLAALMCEDNLIKTFYLYNQMKDKEQSNNNNKIDEEYMLLADKIKQSYKIINDLYQRVINIRGNKNKKKSNNNNCNNYFDSYSKYRNKEIYQYTSNSYLTNNIRNVFGSNIKKDDWIQLLNIGNIMYLSALNYDDLDLDSDPKYELLRDAILEKVVMLTVAYFCIATELRFLSPDKKNTKTNGEFYHYKAVEFASLFLPVSCPIVKHYITSYYKHYGNDMNVVPEGEVCNMKIELVRSEIEQDKDALTFVTAKKLGYTGSTNWMPSIKTTGKESEFDLPNNSYLAKRTKIKEEIAPKFKLNFMNLNNNNNNDINNINNNSHIRNDSIGNINNNFNKTHSQGNTITNNNNSERILDRQQAETERKKVNNMNISKKNYNSNNERKLNSKNLIGRKKKSGSVTDRVQNSKVKFNVSNKSQERLKCKTERELHPSKFLVKSQDNINKDSSNPKMKNEDKTKYKVKLNGKENCKNWKTRPKKETNTTLLDKLLSHNKAHIQYNNFSSSSTCSSINSLIKSLKPPNKKK